MVNFQVKITGRSKIRQINKNRLENFEEPKSSENVCIEVVGGNSENNYILHLHSRKR